MEKAQEYDKNGEELSWAVTEDWENWMVERWFKSQF